MAGFALSIRIFLFLECHGHAGKIVQPDYARYPLSGGRMGSREDATPVDWQDHGGRKIMFSSRGLLLAGVQSHPGARNRRQAALRPRHATASMGEGRPVPIPICPFADATFDWRSSWTTLSASPARCRSAWTGPSDGSFEQRRDWEFSTRRQVVRFGCLLHSGTYPGSISSRERGRVMGRRNRARKGSTAARCGLGVKKNGVITPLNLN